MTVSDTRVLKQLSKLVDKKVDEKLDRVVARLDRLERLVDEVRFGARLDPTYGGMIGPPVRRSLVQVSERSITATGTRGRNQGMHREDD